MADLVKIPEFKTFSFVYQLLLDTGEEIILDTGEGMALNG